MRPDRIEPGPGQESVWDYPRPPALAPTTERIRVVHRGRVVADTARAVRVLETSQPPAYYVPRAVLPPAAGAQEVADAPAELGACATWQPKAKG